MSNHDRPLAAATLGQSLWPAGPGSPSTTATTRARVVASTAMPVDMQAPAEKNNQCMLTGLACSTPSQARARSFNH